MKKIIQLTLSIIMISNLSNGYSQNINEAIQNIRKNFATIESSITNGDYQKKTVEFENSENNEYGSITFYYDNKTLKKIVYDLVINEENNQKTSFYVNNEKLFFVFHESTAPKVINQTKMEYHYAEKRFYFKDDQAIRCLLKEYKKDSKTKEAKNEISKKTANKEVNCNEALIYLKQFEDLMLRKDKAL